MLSKGTAVESRHLTELAPTPNPVFLLASRSLTTRYGEGKPIISYDLERVISDSAFTNVNQSLKRKIDSQIIKAYEWCGKTYPLYYSDGQNKIHRFIVSITIGNSAHRSEILTASSIQNIGNMILMADWPLPSVFRLGSLFAHEATHQLLFLREQAGETIRSRSVGYSPWKGTLRKGRLIWHSFWSFTCQFVFLSERVVLETEVYSQDKGILKYLAEMYSKLSICTEELIQRNIVSMEELSACETAFHEVTKIQKEIVSRFDNSELFCVLMEKEYNEYREWASSLIEARYHITNSSSGRS